MRQHPDPHRSTVAAYDAAAPAYASATAVVPDSARAGIEAFARRLPSGALVLEIGSGGGRDAALMEGLGLRVRRTDVTPAFVDLLRDRGHEAHVVDPLADDLLAPDGGYDGIWANASLLHVARADLATVLDRLRLATRPGGLLRLSVKEGDGDGWSTHGAVPAPRHFTYWRAGSLREVVAAGGWTGIEVEQGIAGKRGETWLEVTGTRP